MTIFLTARDPFSKDPTSDAVAHLETGNLPAARMWAYRCRDAGLSVYVDIRDENGDFLNDVFV